LPKIENIIYRGGEEN